MPVWTTFRPGQFSAWRSRATAFPRWGIPFLALTALPGLLAALLSIVLLGASLLALFLLVTPVFTLIRWLAAVGGRRSQVPLEATVTSPGTKPVEVRVLESARAST